MRPVERPGCRHVYHLYIVRVSERDRVRERLASVGVGTAIHYPVPVHRQPAYADGAVRAGALPHTEQAATAILSLPMYPTLTDDQACAVASVLAVALDGGFDAAQDAADPGRPPGPA